MIKTPVIAIGLDAADPQLMEAWMSQGYLPNLNQIRQHRPAPPTITRNIRNGWAADVWGLLDEPNPIKRLWRTWTHKKFLRGDKHGLQSPHRLMAEDSALGWMPAMWYQSLWPQMKAFALPAFADGYIRINVQGRECGGIVAPADYDAVCAEIAEMLYLLQDGRTRQPLVKQVVRTRTSPLDDDAKLADPDLIVVWHEIPTDVVDHPDLGRIGPLTYNRSGSHREHGFLMASGSGITPGADLTPGGAVDVGATILDLMGADIPSHFDGKSLLQPAVVV